MAGVALRWHFRYNHCLHTRCEHEGAGMPSGTKKREKLAFEVRESPVHGRGVFARKSRDAGQMLWTDPVLLVPNDELDGIVSWYVVEWDDEHSALPLGRTSFLNHDPSPNAMLLCDIDELEICVIATSPIDEGDELFIDYGPDHAAQLD